MSENSKLRTEQSLTGKLAQKSRGRRRDLVRLAEASAPPQSRRNDILPDLKLVSLPLEQLRSGKRSVRRPDAPHIREVAASIEVMGFCTPILVGSDNLVLDGEVRLAAAKLLGLPSVPCIRIDHLSEAEQRLLRLTVNRLAEKGEWDLAELKLELQDLIVIDIPIEIAGFTVDEVDHILLADDSDGVETGPLEPRPGAQAKARLGDIYALGPHRIVCGDARDPLVLSRLMDDAEVAQLLLTDEPYNVKIGGHVTSGEHREFAMASGEMSDEEFLAFNVAWLEAALPHLADGSIIGSFIDWRGFHIVHEAAARLALTPLNLIVWAKSNAGMGSLYRSQHELLPLFKKGDAPHVNTVELGKRGRWRSNLWTYPGASSLGSDARRGLIDHPTVKPQSMLQDALLDLTNRGDIVLDTFLGSGSTLMAAEATGRVCRGVELDPLYVDVIVDRYSATTGRSAMLQGSAVG